MASISKNFKIVAYLIGGLILFAIIISLFPSSAQQNTTPDPMNTVALLITGLILGAIIMFLIWKLASKSKARQAAIAESSHTVVESVRKVFKVVFAEGHFNELYNFEETKKLFGFIPSTKRALVVIKAKVLVGYNFEKCVWETDEENQKIKLISFPEPEIISIEPDYLYYNFDEGILNLLNKEDLTRIQANGKKQVEEAAIKSHLPKIAADQMRTLLTEVVQSRNWQLEDSYKITEATQKPVPPLENRKL